MDGIERLECVYYPGPIPSNRAVLTSLCFIFDKIYFPGVYLPKGGFDEDMLRHEIARIEALKDNSYDTHLLIAAMKFLEYRIPLDGILEYPTTEFIFGWNDKGENKARARAIYDSHYPPRENFEPMFTTSHSKGLPGSRESVDYLGDFFYQAEAMDFAQKNDLALVNDGSAWEFPFRAQYKDNAQSLAMLLAFESVGLVLPDLPVLTPQEIVEFRMENSKELKNFRGAMFRFAKSLNSLILEDTSDEELQRKTKFVLDTEIKPSLHELNRDLTNPNRPWHRRIIDTVRITSSVATGFFTTGLAGTTAADGIKSIILSEFEGKGEKLQAAKRNGLYYLLKAKGIKD